MITLLFTSGLNYPKLLMIYLHLFFQNLFPLILLGLLFLLPTVGHSCKNRQGTGLLSLRNWAVIVKELGFYR